MLLSALSARGLQARTLTLKIKSSSFRTHESTRSLHAYFGARCDVPIAPVAKRQLADACRRFGAELRAAGAPEEYRLLGLRATNLRLAREAEAKAGGLARFLKCGSLNSAPTCEQSTSSGGDDDGGVEDASASTTADRANGRRGTCKDIIIHKPVDDDVEGIEEVDEPEATGERGMCACPVCGSQLPNDNLSLNQHLDACLDQNLPPQLSDTECAERIAGGVQEEGAAHSHQLPNMANPCDGSQQLSQQVESSGGISMPHDARISIEDLRLRTVLTSSAIGEEAGSCLYSNVAPIHMGEAAILQVADSHTAHDGEGTAERDRSNVGRSNVSLGQTASGLSAVGMATDQWACGACTLVNPAENRRCQLCDALKGSSLPAAATLAAQPQVAGRKKPVAKGRWWESRGLVT